MTTLGCVCTTSCGASVTDAFKCDWCYVEGSCGLNSLRGRYDYCVYPDDEAFANQSFVAKTDFFWQKMTADTTRAASYPSVTVAVSTSVQTSFHSYSDEMPAGRVKSIHTVGSICQFSLDVDEGSPFTGLFAPGPKIGFARMGGAIAWEPSSEGLTPGIGFNFQRSGMFSGSTVALVTLEAATFNFFQYNFSNHIAEPKSAATLVLAKKFEQASQCPSQVGLSDMASYTQDGVAVPTPKTPFKLFFVPTDEVQRPNTPKSIDDVMADMASFPVGTRLLTVYACARGNGDAELNPTEGGVEQACGEPYLLGDMVTTTACTTSAYGDAKFFFRHQLIEEDWAANPEFLEQYDVAAACGYPGADLTPDGTPTQCGV